MTGSQFPNLFSPLEIRGLTLKNRIFSPAHGTSLGERGRVGDIIRVKVVGTRRMLRARVLGNQRVEVIR